MIGSNRRRRQHRYTTAVAGALPVLTGTSHAEFGSGTSGNITLPGTLLAGDIVLLCAFGAAGSAPPTPTGYALVKNASVSASGSFVGMVAYLFSKTAVAGDIGATVSISGMSGSWPWELISRTYTAGRIDTSAASAVNGSPLAPPALTSTLANEMMVSFLAVTHQSSSTVGDTLSAGGSDTSLLHNATGFASYATEDWALATVGSGATGGGLNSSATSPSLAGASVILTPVGQ